MSIINDTNGYQYNTGTGEEYGPTLYGGGRTRRDQYGRTLLDRLYFKFYMANRTVFIMRHEWFIGARK